MKHLREDRLKELPPLWAAELAWMQKNPKGYYGGLSFAQVKDFTEVRKLIDKWIETMEKSLL